MGELRIRSHGPRLLMGDLGLTFHVLSAHKIPLGAVVTAVRTERLTPEMTGGFAWEDLVIEYEETP